MTIPKHPLVITGGCNCGAVRYKIDIPEDAKRPLNPASNGEVTFPVVLTDHCNDCRKALGAILPTWICVPTTFMTCKLRARTEVVEESPTRQKGDEIWLPSVDFFYPGPQTADYWLTFYKSSENTTRSFCGKCGTNLTYSVSPSMGDGWPDLFDVVLGTIDKEFLQEDWMAPSRHCWTECEIPWIKRLTNGVPEMSRHPTYILNEYVE